MRDWIGESNGIDEDESAPDDQSGFRRQWIYLLLIAIALGSFLARATHTRARDKQTPFLSANDRSRWCNVASLLDYGTYEIDRVIQRKGWDSIDKVSHYGRDGEQHYYSSKPPILAYLLAWETFVVQKVTGKKLSQAPFYVGRTVLVITNGTLLLILFWVVWCALERWGRSDLGRAFVMAVVTLGTLLSTFAISINNHLPGAVAVAVAMYLLLTIWYEGEDDWWRYALAGFAAACAAACELPALSLLVGVIGALLLKSPKKAIIAALPSIALVVAAYLGTTHMAHDSWRPPYMHRADGETWEGDNWYAYDGTYWVTEKKGGFDVGEPSKGIYGFHVIAGHHGVLSLTPVWLLSIVGAFQWLGRKRFAFFLAVAGLTVICLYFYIYLRPIEDRNYGGSCCGFRWAFWLIPLWLFAMIPAADWFAGHRAGRIAMLCLLVVSVFSATYPLLNPWTHPWLWVYWTNLGWL